MVKWKMPKKPRAYIYVHKVKFTKGSCGRHKKRMNKSEKRSFKKYRGQGHG